jgi:CheY-like chemotaxis protein/DNA-binding XRE family transcriptional regulator
MIKDNLPILRFFGMVVREFRKERRMSQEELANRSGLHRTYITDIERGTRNVSLKNITRIAEAIGIGLPEMFARFEVLSKQESAAPDDAAALSYRRKPVEILLVEDDENFIELTVHALERWNISNTVHVVRNGADALEFLFEHSPSNEQRVPNPKVILLDLNIPLVDGFEVLERIRNNPKTKEIPVVVLTSSSGEADKARCSALGVDEFLTKPINAELFSSVMRRLGFHLLLLEADETARP